MPISDVEATAVLGAPDMLKKPITMDEANLKKCKFVDQLQADGSVKSLKKCKRLRMKQQDSVPRNETLDEEIRQGAIEQLKEWAEKKTGKFGEFAKKALQDVQNGVKLAKKKAGEKIRRIPKKFKDLKQGVQILAKDVAAEAKAVAKDVAQHLKAIHQNDIVVAQDPEDTLTMQMMATLDKVFFVLASDEEAYNRVVGSLPGSSTSGPLGANTTLLPYDFFLQLTNGTEDAYEGQEREPGRFYRGEEEQWDNAVKELYQGMIDRIDDLWKSLIAFSENNESWSMWAARWILGPFLQIDVADAAAVLQLCKKVMLILCKGDDVTAACKNPLLQGVRIRLDLNEQWSRHCTADSKLSYAGSMFCGLGDRSDFANFVTRIKPVPLPQGFRTIKKDWVIAICNTVLYLVLSPKEYYQELINDLNLLAKPLLPDEMTKMKEYEAERDKAPPPTGFLKKELAELAKADQLRNIKKLRITKGQHYVFADLDWAIKYLELLLQSNSIRARFNAFVNNKYLAGIEVPARELVGAISYKP